MMRAWLAALCVVLGSPAHADSPATTHGAIAIANLDHQIAQRRDGADIGELLLLRARLFGDYAALDTAAAYAEASSAHLPRARAYAALHRFADALTALAAAERAGEDARAIAAQRATIAVATGDAARVLSALEADATAHPGYAAHSALGHAYAALGRYTDADRAYASALAALDTTSPFPYAWLWFVRGMMWAEQAGDPARGEAMYMRALAHLPGFVTANVHVAELEAARGATASAIARLEAIADSREPELLATLGELYLQRGDTARGARAISAARERYEHLLARYPLAFADHAAEFFLGPGHDPERAWRLARQNLAARPTDRAFELAITAATAAGHLREARALRAR